MLALLFVSADDDIRSFARIALLQASQRVKLCDFLEVYRMYSHSPPSKNSSHHLCRSYSATWTDATSVASSSSPVLFFTDVSLPSRLWSISDWSETGAWEALAVLREWIMCHVQMSASTSRCSTKARLLLRRASQRLQRIREVSFILVLESRSKLSARYD